MEAMNPSRDPEFGGVAISLRPIDLALHLWQRIDLGNNQNPFRNNNLISTARQPTAVIRQFSDHLSLFSQWTAKPANAIIEATLFIIWQHYHHPSPPPRISRCSGRSSCRPRTRFSTENRRRESPARRRREKEERQVGRRRRRAQKLLMLTGPD